MVAAPRQPWRTAHKAGDGDGAERLGCKKEKKEVVSSPRCDALGEENGDSEAVVAKINAGNPSSGGGGSLVRLDPMTREGGPGTRVRARVSIAREVEEGRERDRGKPPRGACTTGNGAAARSSGRRHAHEHGDR
jgi:hypothetical protein